MVDPDQPISNVHSMEQLLSDSVSRRRFNLILLGSFAAVALLLASVGIYGVLSYTVTQRTHEIGVRMALGSNPGRVFRLIVTQAMGLIAAGLAVGMLSAYIVVKFASSLLYEVSPYDSLTFTAVPILLTGVAILASAIPALRATRVDPIVALRYE